MATHVFRIARSSASGISQAFTVELEPRMTVLDALFLIQRRQDAGLAFRCSCRVGMCPALPSWRLVRATAPARHARTGCRKLDRTSHELECWRHAPSRLGSMALARGPCSACHSYATSSVFALFRCARISAWPCDS